MATQLGRIIFDRLNYLGDSLMTSISNFQPRTSPTTRGVAKDDLALRPSTNQWEKASSPETTTKKPWNNFAELDPEVAKKVDKMPQAVHEETSKQLHIANTKIAELEEKLKLATSTPTSHPAPAAMSAAMPTGEGKLKKMAGAVKQAFENVPWKTVGKAALYGTAAVAGFALLSNPIGAIGMALSCVGMLTGSSLLPTALGLAGAGAAAYQVHKWIGKKSDQPGQTGHAPTHHPDTRPFSQSLAHPA